jgi:hypothetical protein
MAYTTINKPSEYFNTKLYTGDNTATSYTGVGFQPDFIWIKDRSQTADHTLIDSVRGVKKVILSNSTAAEGTDGATQGLNSFDSDGFTLGTNSNAGSTNNTGDNYVAWNWLGGGTGVSNTDGDITATVSASTTSGFSIVKWTGTGSDGTIGHGLGVAPKMVIVKSLANTTAWMVYHASLGNAQEIYLNTTNASGASTAWNSTTPTPTVISLDGGAGDGVNASGDYVAYVFAEKKGFSKFGSYTGNGNADGTFVYTGFKPAFVMVKKYNTTEDWFMYDNKRNGFNPDNFRLKANDSASEDPLSTGQIDLLSNGWKFKNSGTQYNANGDSYIYMAFAENPLVGTNNIPATAR